MLDNGLEGESWLEKHQKAAVDMEKDMEKDIEDMEKDIEELREKCGGFGKECDGLDEKEAKLTPKIGFIKAGWTSTTG